MSSSVSIDSNEEGGMTYFQHGWQKCKEQPMVPVGVAATTFALLGATASLRSGNRKQFQHFLRLRVAAQGITVVAMVVGAYMISNKAEETRKSRERALNGQLPPDAGARAEEPVVVTAIKERRPEDTDAAYDHLYPTRQKTKVSDFTRRLRAAEEQHAADVEMSHTEQMARAREDSAAVAAAAERMELAKK
ncbi:hypothetical protein CspeluHIS016_0603710 [Cutaneotrichosporon spelunceum]|uniref:HIG1 domain-containing protein n=1 Tax=Cutaneotrichosporon spelunceum TaxID=1672016 RepID=A0AAD3YEE3_9TREE|nr:hypothetical protein CspeluHIS016_0603710 [Cutaneotrichosporon spelunceum]